MHRISRHTWCLEVALKFWEFWGRAGSHPPPPPPPWCQSTMPARVILLLAQASLCKSVMYCLLGVMTCMHHVCHGRVDRVGGLGPGLWLGWPVGSVARAPAMASKVRRSAGVPGEPLQALLVPVCQDTRTPLPGAAPPAAHHCDAAGPRPPAAVRSRFRCSGEPFA